MNKKVQKNQVMKFSKEKIIIQYIKNLSISSVHIFINHLNAVRSGYLYGLFTFEFEFMIYLSFSFFCLLQIFPVYISYSFKSYNDLTYISYRYFLLLIEFARYKIITIRRRERSKKNNQ